MVVGGVAGGEWEDEELAEGVETGTVVGGDGGFPPGRSSSADGAGGLKASRSLSTPRFAGGQKWNFPLKSKWEKDNMTSEGRIAAAERLEE